MSNLQFFENTGWTREQKTPITTAESAPSVISTTVPTSMIVVEGYRGIRIMVIGDTSNDDVDCTIYAIERSQSREGDTTYISRPLARMDTILIGDSTLALSGELGTPLEFLADTYTTNVAQGHGTSVFALAIAGAVVSLTPTGNVSGWWGVTDLGNAHGVVVGFPTLNTGNYFSYCYMLDR